MSTPTPTPGPDFAAVDAYVAGLEDASGIAEVIVEHARVGPPAAGELPAEVVKVAAKALLNAAADHGHVGGERAVLVTLADGVDAVLAAALPLIRAHIADELDEQANHEAPNAAEALRFAAGQIAAGLPQLHAVVSARRVASRMARGGTDGTEETK